MKFEQTHKDLISYLIACIMVLSGIVLAYFSFFILHLIENSILGFISLGITFAGAIFGITQILRDKFKTYEVSTNKAIMKKLKELEEEDKKEDSD